MQLRHCEQRKQQRRRNREPQTPGTRLKLGDIYIIHADRLERRSEQRGEASGSVAVTKCAEVVWFDSVQEQDVVRTSFEEEVSHTYFSN